MVKVLDILNQIEDKDADREWSDHIVETLLACDEEYSAGLMTVGAYVNTIHANLQKLRKHIPVSDVQ